VNGVDGVLIFSIVDLGAVGSEITDFNGECTWQQKSQIIQNQDQKLVFQRIPHTPE
jgi:hypothetical protein